MPQLVSDHFLMNEVHLNTTSGLLLPWASLDYIKHTHTLKIGFTGKASSFLLNCWYFSKLEFLPGGKLLFQ